MANSKKLIEHHPAFRDFQMHDLVGFRGDVLSYWPNVTRDSFSTDAQGFRHSRFKGRDISVIDCTRSARYGLALGPSSMFGVGLSGNAAVMPSLLAERFGFPFANAAMPGGNSRNLQSLLIGLMSGSKVPPAVVVLSNGGDLANFCSAGAVDPIFGSPNQVLVKAIGEKGLKSDLKASFQKLLAFTTLWTSATATLCRARKIPLVMVHQSSFFDKSKPTKTEIDCALGGTADRRQQKVFTNFRNFGAPFYANRAQLAKRLQIPLAGYGLIDQLTFIDEFHLDQKGMAVLSKAVGDAIEPLVTSAKPKAKKAKA